MGKKVEMDFTVTVKKSTIATVTSTATSGASSSSAVVGKPPTSPASPQVKKSKTKPVFINPDNSKFVSSPVAIKTSRDPKISKAVSSVKNGVAKAKSKRKSIMIDSDDSDDLDFEEWSSGPKKKQKLLEKRAVTKNCIILDDESDDDDEILEGAESSSSQSERSSGTSNKSSVKSKVDKSHRREQEIKSCASFERTSSPTLNRIKERTKHIIKSVSSNGSSRKEPTKQRSSSKTGTEKHQPKKDKKEKESNVPKSQTPEPRIVESPSPQVAAPVDRVCDRRISGSSIANMSSASLDNEYAELQVIYNEQLLGLDDAT